jgi:hypothetical protein
LSKIEVKLMNEFGFCFEKSASWLGQGAEMMAIRNPVAGFCHSAKDEDELLAPSRWGSLGFFISPGKGREGPRSSPAT